MDGHEKLKNQSREWLAQSLLMLMERKMYQDITVGQIADHAKLSRRTFYRSFKSKEEVMEFITDNLSRDYLVHIKNFEIREFDTGVIPYIFFSFFEAHYDILKLFQKNGLEYQVLNLFNKYLPVLVDQMGVCDGENAVYQKHFLRFTSGGFYNLLLYWLENNMQMSATEMSETVTKALQMYWKRSSREAFSL